LPPAWRREVLFLLNVDLVPTLLFYWAGSGDSSATPRPSAAVTCRGCFFSRIGGGFDLNCRLFDRTTNSTPPASRRSHGTGLIQTTVGVAVNEGASAAARGVGRHCGAGSAASTTHGSIVELLLRFFALDGASGGTAGAAPAWGRTATAVASSLELLIACGVIVSFFDVVALVVHEFILASLERDLLAAPAETPGNESGGESELSATVPEQRRV
jgi:hypothetical protein